MTPKLDLSSCFTADIGDTRMRVRQACTTCVLALLLVRIHTESWVRLRGAHEKV